MNRASFIGLPFALVLFAHAPRAAAQAVAPEPSPEAPSEYGLPVAEPVAVLFEIDKGLLLDVVSATGTHVRELSADSCRAACRLALQPGEYTMRVRESQGGVLVDQSVVSVDRPMRYRVHRPESGGSDARINGLVLAITGHVVSIVGLFVAGEAMMSDMLCEEAARCGDHGTAELLGAAAIVGGLAASTVGWVVFAQARSSGDDNRVVTPIAAPQPRLTVSVAPLPGGAGFAGALRF
jgi:hypothetical protein